MSSEINSKVLEYTKVSGRALHLAGELAKEAAAKEAAAKEAVPRIVALLKTARDANGAPLIAESDIKRAEAQLGNHSQCLAVLGNVLGVLSETTKIAKSASDRLGSAEPLRGATKVASTEASYGDKRAGAGEVRESDKALMRLIPGYAG